jgi:hypothetical protein
VDINASLPQVATDQCVTWTLDGAVTVERATSLQIGNPDLIAVPVTIAMVPRVAKDLELMAIAHAFG